MATADRYVQKITCRCGSIVEVFWLDRAYQDADPEIERVIGPAIKRKHKSALTITKDRVDVLCGRCGRVLHRSEAAGKVVQMATAARR
jgi:hypothetical protein